MRRRWTRSNVDDTSARTTDRTFVPEHIGWWHTIDLGDGEVTRGAEGDTAAKLDYIGIPRDLTGLGVLDIGTWDGFFAFECERRGAARVVATDSLMWQMGSGRAGFDYARGRLQSRVEALHVDVMQISPETVYGHYDIVLLLGVLYHMLHPLLALQRAASVTRSRLIIETQAAMLTHPSAAIAFYPGAELNDDASNWYAPNLLALEGMCRAVGFNRVMVSVPTWAEQNAGELVPITADVHRSWLGDVDTERVSVHAFRA